jgi:hypothetical protein
LVSFKTKSGSGGHGNAASIIERISLSLSPIVLFYVFGLYEKQCLDRLLFMILFIVFFLRNVDLWLYIYTYIYIFIHI